MFDTALFFHETGHQREDLFGLILTFDCPALGSTSLFYEQISHTFEAIIDLVRIELVFSALANRRLELSHRRDMSLQWRDHWRCSLHPISKNLIRKIACLYDFPSITAVRFSKCDPHSTKKNILRQRHINCGGR